MNRASRPRLSRIAGSSYASRAMTRSGDGSTLSLDFTTGQLDPRVTFTRSSNATFINAQGYVTVADANMFVNSAWTDANNTPTGWNLGFGTGSVSRSNETRTLTCTAQQYWWYQQPASKSGLTYSVSVEVTAVSGSIVYGDIILAGSSTYIAWYKNGVVQAGGSSTAVTTGVITLIFTANSDNTILRLGLGSAGTNVTGSVTLRYPQFQLGQVPLRSYYENTSTSAARYNSARFDYDPSTLEPKGLLIEGAATNLLNWSESFATSGGTNNNWADTNLTRTSTNNTDPANNTTALRITASAGNGTIISSAAIGSSAERTFSVWLRRVTGTGNIQYTQDNGTNWTTQAITSSWVRYTFTHTANHRVGIRIVTSGDAIELWGAQLEAGSGVSSYIAAGASTATKSNDFAVISGSNFTGWFTGGTTGTFFADWYGGVRGVASNVRSVLATTDLSTQHLHMFQISAAGALRVADFNGANSATTSNSVTSGARTKGAFSFAYPGSGTTSTVNACLNGGTVASSATMAFSAAPTFVSLGLPSTNGTTTSNADVILNNSIRSIKYWPTVLSNAQMQALTT